MDITCHHCHAKFKLPDEKVPPGKTFALTCPKCKQRLTVTAALPSASNGDRSLVDEVSSAGYDAAERPFDFIEEGAKTAIVCENDPEYQAKVLAALQGMGYYITQALSARDVLKQMRFHNFDLVVINERFDTTDPDRNSVMRYLERMPMATRRDMFVALISDRFRTMDNMAAFHKSVNLVVNVSNLEDLAKILKRGVSDNERFYQTLKEGLVRVGRA
jgi:predicted Zn finger-like uncharacterized protein